LQSYTILALIVKIFLQYESIGSLRYGALKTRSIAGTTGMHTGLALFDQNFFSKEKRGGVSLISQSFDGVEHGSFPGGVESEKYSDRSGKEKR
jgi:hypothetical protein